MAREVRVEIVGDSRSVEAAYARSAKAAKSFNQTVTGAVAPANLKRQAIGFASGYLAVGTAATAATAGLKTSVDAASNLNEQIAKSEVVFGSASDAIEKWSQTTARSIGIAQDEALAAAGTFGNLFVTMGIGQKTSANMSKSLVQLAADLAAFNNTNPTEALDALRSGLVGEAEPLRRYGVRLSEARVQQVALAATGKRNVKALTEQEKALARYRIILDDTKTAQGNFRDTSEGFAQQTKVLRAELRDLSASIGNSLIPALTGIVTTINEVITGFRKGADAARDFKKRVEETPVIGRPAKAAGGHLDTLLFLTPAAPFKAGYEGINLLIGGIKRLAGETRKTGLEAQDLLEKYRLMRDAIPEGLAAKDKIELRGLGTPPQIPGGTIEQRNQWFDARIARQMERVQDIPTLKGQVARMREIAQQIRARIAATKDTTRLMRLEDDLLRVQRDIRSTQATMQANAAQAERDALAHQEEMARLARERAEKAREQRQAGLFAVLGFDPGGAERAPGIAALRRRFARVADALVGSPLAGKFKTQMANIRKVLSDEFTKTDKELRDKIEEMLAGIDSQLKDHAETRGRFRTFNVNAMLAGLGLSPDEIRKLRGRLSRIGPGGTVPGAGQGAFGMALAGAGGVTVHHQTIVDGRVVESSVTKRQQNRRRRNPAQKRGPYIGTLG